MVQGRGEGPDQDDKTDGNMKTRETLVFWFGKRSDRRFRGRSNLSVPVEDCDINKWKKRRNSAKMTAKPFPPNLYGNQAVGKRHLGLVTQISTSHSSQGFGGGLGV